MDLERYSHRDNQLIAKVVRLHKGIAKHPKVEGTDKSAHNEALSYNKLHAINGEFHEQTFDYTKALVSAGTLEPALNPTFSKKQKPVWCFLGTYPKTWIGAEKMTGPCCLSIFLKR